MFRFTITSLDPELSAFWEPFAPHPKERLQALAHAFGKGFRTSVSCEPMLAGPEAAINLVRKVEPWITDSIWVGKMQRVPRKLNAHVPGFEEALELVKAQQKDAEILKLVEALKSHPKLRWKDSIKSVRNPTYKGQPVKLKDKHGGDWNEWAADLRIRELPEAFTTMCAD